jgi:hypothetical protein
LNKFLLRAALLSMLALAIMTPSLVSITDVAAITEWWRV